MSKFVSLAIILVLGGLATAQSPAWTSSKPPVAVAIGSATPAGVTPGSGPGTGGNAVGAQLPNVYIDTTWNLPTGGTTWAAHTSAQLASALNVSSPGDVIVLDAGVSYTGNFQLNSKANSNNSGSISSARQSPSCRQDNACRPAWQRTCRRS